MAPVARARAPGRPKPGSIPAGDRTRYAVGEGRSFRMGGKH